ncbi:MAG TPA: hypothetical protein VEF53_17780 [Patescibacteria group bacterium]|jgi:hypothetical protein|nr:hypothetical protein [Patescibacteria group bacterium]
MSYIYVTNHAVKRYRERKKLVSKEHAIEKIVENVKRSKIIAMDKSGKETREYKGLLFVCKMEDSVLTVITIMFSEVCGRFVS